jgi:hypothetical protein
MLLSNIADFRNAVAHVFHACTKLFWKYHFYKTMICEAVKDSIVHSASRCAVKCVCVCVCVYGQKIQFPAGDDFQKTFQFC